MATIIGLPKLSPTMEEGVLAKWYKKEGDKVSPGDLIAEVETDKANMDFPLEDEGTLLRLLVKEGDTVKLGGPVAILGNPGEDITALLAAAAGSQSATAGAPPAAVGVGGPIPRGSDTPSPPPPPPPRASDSDASPAVAGVGGPIPHGSDTEASAATPPVSTPAPASASESPTPSSRLLASPLAKTLAAEHGIDLRSVRGSGPGGRIVERDVLPLLKAAAATPASAQTSTAAMAPAPAPAPVVPSIPGAEFVDQPLSLMRKTIARRLVEAKQTIPHFYLTTDCDAAPLVAFRAALNEVAGETAKATLNDLVIKATALALTRVPAANASFMGDRIRTFARVHIGVAVSVDDGLITPVIRDADKKGLRQIGAEARDLAARARARRLAADELTGSTFTVSNLGMFGIDHFEAVINPPEAAILAVGAVRALPVVAGDKVVPGQRMALTLSCDHRVVDGVLGAKLLAEIVRILEHPAALAL